jgi:AraC-like DNA-binding protein
MLRDPRFAGSPIGWIAAEAGFGDLSYFNRAFCRRYSAAPSDVWAATSKHDGSATEIENQKRTVPATSWPWK